MSDDRISTTPHTPRCPACGGPVATPGVPCAACGKAFPAPTPFVMPELRYRSEEWLLGYDRPVYFGFGFLALFAIGLMALADPVILVLAGVLLVPAGIRTVRLATRPDVDQVPSLVGYLLKAGVASFGAAALSGAVSAVAFVFVFMWIEAMGSSYRAEFAGFVLGVLLAFVVFVAVFMKLWPRERADEVPRPSDPEE